MVALVVAPLAGRAGVATAGGQPDLVERPHQLGPVRLEGQMDPRWVLASAARPGYARSVDATPPNRHKRRLRLLLQGAATGLLAVTLGLAAQDAADRLSGANDPPLRASLRRTVVSSAPYVRALELADAAPVRAALGGAPRVTLEAFAVEDAPDRTRLRFTLRLEPPAGHEAARLQVEATWSRGAKRWTERFWLERPGAPALALTPPS